MNEIDEPEPPGAAAGKTAAKEGKVAVEHDGAREALEAQLRLVVEQVPAHLWTTDDQLRVTSVSGSTFAQLGVDPSAYVGRSILDLIPDGPSVVAAHQAALRAEIGEYEREFRGRLFACRVCPLRSAQGEVIGCLGLALDITERRRAERRLVTQYEVSRVLAEAADLDEAAPRILEAIGDCLEWVYGGLWMIDRGEDVLRCAATWHAPDHAFPELEAANQRVVFARGVGLPGRAWATRQPVWITDATTEADFPRLAVAAAEGLRGGFGLPILVGGDVVGVLEFFGRQVRDHDPELLEMAAALGGQIGQFVERTRAEVTVRESAARTAAILASALDAVITIDHNGCIVEFNPAAERIFGYAREEAMGRELAEIIVPPPLRDRHRQGLARAIAGGDGPVLDRRVEMTAMRADGTEFPVELAVTRVPADGPPLFTGYVRDITDRT
ncbi:MAG: PAS domain S-box protein, partial [Chloroflexi bacterium]|nr:PAS domain S-box protein [Chloroflexota bacterium]